MKNNPPVCSEKWKYAIIKGGIDAEKTKYDTTERTEPYKPLSVWWSDGRSTGTAGYAEYHFRQGKYRYTFAPQCEEVPDCRLNDGAVRIFLNIRGENPQDVSDELVYLLHYLEDTTDAVAGESQSKRIGRIHERVRKVKSSEEIGVKYMQAWEERYYEKEEAREEGRAEGIEEGKREGITEGKAAGKKEGVAKVVSALIETYVEMKMTREEMKQKLMQKLELEEQVAEQYLDDYRDR